MPSLFRNKQKDSINFNIIPCPLKRFLKKDISNALTTASFQSVYEADILTKMSSALESEDLENVPLVRMEDVQPSRTYELMSRPRSQEVVVLESCVIEEIEYDNECIVNDDDDSNIGSMVSIKSEEILDDDSEPEMIVPEMIEEESEHVLEPITTYHGLRTMEEQEEAEKPPSSWPTLEILPGGVIKKPQQSPDPLSLSPSEDDPSTKPEEMMYACAKCPQRFKFLFCLVKHVKLHEDETKKLLKRATESNKATICDNLCSHTKKRKTLAAVNAPKKKSPKKIKS